MKHVALGKKQTHFIVKEPHTIIGKEKLAFYLSNSRMERKFQRAHGAHLKVGETEYKEN